jgi:DNA-binding GntR family transcriptional regulator
VTASARIRKAEANRPDFLTERQVCEWWQVSRATVRRLRAAGVIVTYTIHGTTMKRFKRSELEALIRAEPPIETAAAAAATTPLKAVR